MTAGSAPLEHLTLTNAGRVLGVTALDSHLAAARARAYEAVAKIHFDGAYYGPEIAADVGSE